jgi:uncharacterized protein (DUF2062 family)
MSRKFFRKYLPSHEAVRRNRYIGVFGSLLSHHNLWHLHRRSVAGGVAVGLFSGLVPGPLQMISAAILAIIFKVNLPVALVVTFYTNPFTIVPLYYAAYKLGRLVLFESGNGAPAVVLEMPGLSLSDISSWLPSLLHWGMSLGKPLAIGLPLLALLLAVVGYFVVDWTWRLQVIYGWRQRARRHRKRMES